MSNITKVKVLALLKGVNNSSGVTPNKVNEGAKSPSTASAAAGSKGTTPKLSMARLQAQLLEQVKCPPFSDTVLWCYLRVCMVLQVKQQQQSSPASAASKVSPFDSLRREILAHLHSAIFKVNIILDPL